MDLGVLPAEIAALNKVAELCKNKPPEAIIMSMIVMVNKGSAVVGEYLKACAEHLFPLITPSEEFLQRYQVSLSKSGEAVDAISSEYLRIYRSLERKEEIYKAQESTKKRLKEFDDFVKDARQKIIDEGQRKIELINKPE